MVRSPILDFESFSSVALQCPVQQHSPAGIPWGEEHVVAIEPQEVDCGVGEEIKVGLNQTNDV
jgi:hypothetical protein